VCARVQGSAVCVLECRAVLCSVCARVQGNAVHSAVCRAVLCSVQGSTVCVLECRAVRYTVQCAGQCYAVCVLECRAMPYTVQCAGQYYAVCAGTPTLFCILLYCFHHPIFPFPPPLSPSLSSRCSIFLTAVMCCVLYIVTYFAALP
jgi:hypothetical protein